MTNFQNRQSALRDIILAGFTAIGLAACLAILLAESYRIDVLEKAKDREWGTGEMADRGWIETEGSPPNRIRMWLPRNHALPPEIPEPCAPARPWSSTIMAPRPPRPLLRYFPPCAGCTPGTSCPHAPL